MKAKLIFQHTNKLTGKTITLKSELAKLPRDAVSIEILPTQSCANGAFTSTHAGVVESLNAILRGTTSVSVLGGGFNDVYVRHVFKSVWGVTLPTKEECELPNWAALNQWINRPEIRSLYDHGIYRDTNGATAAAPEGDNPNEQRPATTANTPDDDTTDRDAEAQNQNPRRRVRIVTET